MALQVQNRPTWAEIDLDHLAFNLHSVKRFIGQEIEYMAVVKADAYGHGAAECARRLQQEQIDWFGVALASEGVELRKSGITRPILCLGSYWPGQAELLIENKLTPVIYQTALAVDFNRAAAAAGKRADIHIKIDTGMNRIGVRPDEIDGFIKELKKLENLHVQGLMTHFPAADVPTENDFTNRQINLFYQITRKFEQEGFSPYYRDLANSPGAVAHKNSRGNLVRLGGILYGLGDDVLPAGIERPQLKPVMSLKTRIAHLKKVPAGETIGYGRTYTTRRDSIIATVPIGYQDGYMRALSNRSQAIVGSRFAPIVGRISMDWTILDVSEIEDPKIGDPVILIGRHNDLAITAEKLARLGDTISYEVTCGINRRVTRLYVESEKKHMV